MKENILHLIGNTPLVKLNNMVRELKPEVFAKLEFYNPSLSTKDRIVKNIIDQAEAEGLIEKGGTLVEATSGNTGASLAMLARVRGYQCILCVKDTVAKEKVQMLKTFGAEIVLCPANVLPDHPDSYYSKAKSIAEHTENAFYVNQNFNTLNRSAHYHGTGKEIWEQTAGKVTHLIASGSTGGTISGAGRYLKEKNPDIKVIGTDTKDSLLKHFHENHSYDKNKIYKSEIEGVGKNIVTGNFDFDIIDEFIYVTKEESAACSRKLVLEDGIWAGHSSGATLQALSTISDHLTEKDTVVLVFSDHGSRYLSKIYNT
jgi:cystathionine beta-synthase